MIGGTDGVESGVARGEIERGGGGGGGGDTKGRGGGCIEEKEEREGVSVSSISITAGWGSHLTWNWDHIWPGI